MDLYDKIAAPFTEEEANRIWDLLMAEAGAIEHWRKDFVYHQTKVDKYGPPNEYRIGGVLGYGGKFWRSYDALHVSFYSEDESDDRNEVVRRTNERLAEMVEEWKNS